MDEAMNFSFSEVKALGDKPSRDGKTSQSQSLFFQNKNVVLDSDYLCPVWSKPYELIDNRKERIEHVYECEEEEKYINKRFKDDDGDGYDSYCNNGLGTEEELNNCNADDSGSENAPEDSAYISDEDEY
jgi:hypothetical protein